MRKTITLLTLFAAAAPAAAQGNPAQAWAQERAAERDRLERRARRDEAWQLAGATEEAAEFIKLYGDDAAKAILHHRNRRAARGPATDQEWPAALVAFWKDGRLEALPDPRAAVGIFSRHGAETQAWVLAHSERLGDSDAWSAFAEDPLEYVYGLRDIGQGAAAAKAKRTASPLAKLQGVPWQTWAVGGAVVLALLAYARERRRNRGDAR